VRKERINGVVDIVRALRPSQWTKNLVVFAALFFSIGDRIHGQVPGLAQFLPQAAKAAAAAALFSLASSGIYLFNDIIDAEADRRHPLKRFRPIAAGRVSIGLAWVLAIVLAVGASAASWLFPRPMTMVIVGYAVLQIVYTLGLKHVPLIDILVIAAGFVLRAIAGGVALRVTISPWLLLCTFLLALFLALCKRRHELVILGGTADQRPSLVRYDERLLDQLIAIVSAATVVCYSIYTLSPETVDKFKTTKVGLTIPFVVFGIFRYLDLVYRLEKGDRPEKVLLTDVPILVNLALYGVAVLLIFVLGR
jgi:4-hydroxybenzoate polyprenyltransferase